MIASDSSIRTCCPAFAVSSDTVPSSGAVTVCSIFIASTTSTGCPALTSCPTLTCTATTVPGPLSEELRRMLQETRMGASRADALRALDERTNVEELRTFIVAMLQADSFGVSIARILRTQADEMRVRRRYLAQEKSQKAPVRMLFPLVLCIFPATLVVVVMPGFMQVFNKL